MGFVPINRHDLDSAYLLVSKVISDFSGFPFFGTLLGLFRDGHLIDGDDDLDFAMNSADIEKFISHINQDSRFLILAKTHCLEEIVQVSFEFKLSENRAILCDVYGYIAEKNHLLFPVHWRDESNNPSKWLRVPISYNSIRMLESYYNSKHPEVLTSSEIREIIIFLYGERWDARLLKNVDYRVDIYQGAPMYDYFPAIKRYRLKFSYSILVWLDKNKSNLWVQGFRRMLAFSPKWIKTAFFRH
jgi:hypothetical protein